MTAKIPLRCDMNTVQYMDGESTCLNDAKMSFKGDLSSSQLGRGCLSTFGILPILHKPYEDATLVMLH
jgi:hypothetical protein